MKTSIRIFCAAIFLTSGPAYSEAMTDYLTLADQAYEMRLDLHKAKEALTLYEKAVVQSSESAEPLWKASRTAWWIGDHAEKRRDKKNIFEKGVDFAKKAVELDPKSPEARFWLAGNYGSFGEAKGILKSLFLVGPIREELHKLNAIDPNFKGGAGFRILGVVDYKVPRFVGGSRKRAHERLTRASKIDPLHVNRRAKELEPS